MKRFLRRWACHGLGLSGITERRRARRVRCGEGWATVLVFHRISATVPEDGLTTSPLRFRRILALLAARYEVLSLTELAGRLAAGPAFTGREVAITFDDGYRDNYEIAAPLLAEFGLPACFFLTVGRIGTDFQFPWDRDRGVQTDLMSWAQARELHDAGLDLGCHTWSHPDLGTLPVTQAHQELVRARSTMEDRLGTTVDQFAYPFGGREHFRPEWREAVVAAGFANNYSAHGGFVTAETDPWLIPRTNGSYQSTLTDLRIDLDRPW